MLLIWGRRMITKACIAFPTSIWHEEIAIEILASDGNGVCWVWIYPRSVQDGFQSLGSCLVGIRAGSWKGSKKKICPSKPIGKADLIAHVTMNIKIASTRSVAYYSYLIKGLAMSYYIQRAEKAVVTFTRQNHSGVLSQQIFLHGHPHRASHTPSDDDIYITP